MTTSPARIAPHDHAARAPPRSRHSRPGGPAGRASHRRSHQRARSKTRDRCRWPRRGSARPGMQRGAARPEFEHVAEHGDAPAARPDAALAEHGERRAHRGRIGVVALVDQQRLRRPATSSAHARAAARPAAAARASASAASARSAPASVAAASTASEFMHEMAAGRAELVGDVVRRGCRRCTAEQSGCSAHVDQPRVGARRARRTRRCARRRRCSARCAAGARTADCRG